MDEAAIRKAAREETAQILADFCLYLKTRLEMTRKPLTAMDIDIAFGQVIHPILPDGKIR